MGGAASPYQAIAPFYNRIMAHVDYAAWARHLRALWRKYGGDAPPRRTLELAAGTCPFAAPPLFPAAFSVYTDPSFAMLHSAGSANPCRVVCDARALALRGPFDLVVMVYDSLNYLLSPVEVRRALRQTRRVLRPGGLFLFDVTTEGCSQRHFADAHDFEELAAPDAGAYIRRSRYDSKAKIQLNLFTFFIPTPDGGQERHEEIHRQRIYPADRIGAFAEQAGFQVRARLAGFTFRPGDDRNDRLHFVLQNP